MNEEMKAAWLEISQMLGEPTREELDVFLRTWQRASQATREALAEQPAQKCSYPYCGCNSKAWCKVERNEALDRMAENARELGLDYEPAQEPAPLRDAIVVNLVREGINKHRARELADHFINLTSPQPAQRTWVGLTDEEYINITDSVYHKGQGLVAYYKAIEAKLKEKNNG